MGMLTTAIIATAGAPVHVDLSYTTWPRWILGSVLAFPFLYLAVYHAMIVWQGFIRKKRTPSWVPLFGGLFGVAAAFVLPVPGLSRWWWVPLFLDYGSVPGLTHTAIWWFLYYRRLR